MYELPEKAATKMAELRRQIQAEQAMYQSYVEGILDGLGVDYVANDVSITPDGKGYTVTPKIAADNPPGEVEVNA